VLLLPARAKQKFRYTRAHTHARTHTYTYTRARTHMDVTQACLHACCCLQGQIFFVVLNCGTLCVSCTRIGCVLNYIFTTWCSIRGRGPSWL